MAKIKATEVVKGLFSNYAPTTINTIDSAKDAANTVRNIGKNVQVGMRRNLQNIDKSQPGRKAIALFTAAKDALRNGDYEIEQANEEMYDDYDSYEDDFSTDSIPEDERADMNPEDVILRGNRGIAKSVIRASTAQLQGMNAVSTNMLKGTLKGMEASTKSINATILYSTNMLSTQMSAANNKLDAINANLVSLLNYQNENTTLYYQTNLELMNNMLNSISNLNSMYQGKGARDLKNFNIRSGINFKEYIDRVKKGIKGSTMVSGAGMLKSMYDMSVANPEISSLGEMIGSFIPTVMSLFPNVGVFNAINGKLNKVTNADKRFRRYMEETLYNIGDKLGSNIIATTLGLDSLGNQRRRNGGIMMSQYMKDQLPWNGKAQKALTEVIPELLTSIDAGINNTDKRYFDFDEGYWKSRKELDEDFTSQITNAINIEFSDLMQKLNKKLEFSGKSESEQSEAKKKLSDAIMDNIYDTDDLTKMRQSIADVLQEMELSADQFSATFNTIMESVANSQEYIADFYSKVGTSDSVFRNINNRTSAEKSKTLGDNAYQTSKKKRRDNDLFSMAFSKDVQLTVDWIERQMKDIDKNFTMTKDIREGILVAVREGFSDQEILRKVKQTVGKQSAYGIAVTKIGKAWAKLRKKEYDETVKPIDEALDEDDFGKTFSDINLKTLSKVYGIHTKYNEPKNKKGNNVGAASSARSKMDGKTAGAGTSRSPMDSGKSFDLSVNSDIDKIKDEIIESATASFDDTMNSPESSLQHDEKVVENAAATITDVGKEGSKTLSGAIKNLIDTSVVSMGAMMNSFSRFGSRLFGKEGLISKFFESKTFKNGLEKIKKTIFYDKDGNLRPAFQKMKDYGLEVWDGTKKKLNKVYDYAYDSYAKYKYGEDYENNEKWQNSKFMQSATLKAKREKKLNDLVNDFNLTAVNADEGLYKDSDGNEYTYRNGKFYNNETKKPLVKKSVEETIENKPIDMKSSVPEIDKVVEETKDSVQKVANDTPQVLKESVEKISEAGNKSAEMIETSTKNMTTIVIGDPEEDPNTTKKKYADTFKKSLKKYLPKVGAGAVLGAGIGMLNGFGGHSLLGSLFLPTGIVGGAIVGGGLSILSQTEAFKSLMFGKEGSDGERSGGLISKKLRDNFKKAAPIAVGGAVAGALGAILKAPFTGGIASGNGLGILGVQMLPGGILGGAITGMGIGLLKNSETFKSLLFGKKDENGKRTGTWLSKSFESMKKKLAGSEDNPGLKKMLKGGALGAVTGTVMAHMGVIPAALSVGGPIGMSIMGLGLGIASSTKKFNSWLFGEEEFDNDGKSLGRKGGVLGRVKNLININVVEPISSTFKSAMLDMVDWAKEKITLPFRTAFGPILDSIREIKDNVVDFVEDKFKAIGEGITSMIKKTLSTLFSPITKLIGGVGKALIGGAKVGLKAAAMPLTMGLGAMNFLTSGKRRKEYGNFYKAYYTKGGMKDELSRYWKAKQEDYDQEAADYNAEADKTGKAHKKAKRVGFFEKTSDFLSALTGQGEIADAARSGWNESADDFGQNTFNWRNVFQEKRKLKANRNERHKAEAQWKKIRKLSQNIGSRDLKGQEVELTDKMFEKYKEKYTKLGIDGNLIKSNEDLMKLIYDPRGFREKAAGDSGRDGMLQALKDFRLTPEEIAERERTAQYQDNVTAVLNEIKDHFKELGDNNFYDDATTSYEKDRKKDMKKLKRKAKKLYDSTLWDGRDVINFNDPELNEYDISGISNDSLQDYATSKYADNGDFKGWLESQGRKMSPNLDTKSEGKSSTENINPKPESKEDSAKELVDTLKEQTNIMKTEAEINAGGTKNFKKLSRKSKTGSLNEKVAKGNGIGGFFNNLFKRKKKDEARNAELAKEAEESKAAQALGDEVEESESSGDVNVNVTTEEKEKKKSIFSKIFGAIGSGFSWFGSTKIGGILKGALKLFGGIGLLGGIGLTIAELVKPGTTEKLGASLSEWNNEIQDSAKEGTILDYFTNTVKGWFDKIGTWINTNVLSEDGYLMKGANAIAEVMPKVLDNVVLPGIERTATFVAENAEPLVSAAGTVVEAIAPPLAEALVNTVPTLVSAIGEALWNKMWGKESKKNGEDHLTDEEVTEAKNSGKYVGSKSEIISAEEAEDAKSKGLNVTKNSDGTYTLENNYTLDSNVYIDKSGNEQTASNVSQTNRLKHVGGKIATNLVTGNLESAARLSGTAVKAGAATLGGVVGATVSPIAGLATATGGAKVGSKLGGWVKSGMESLSTFVAKKGSKVATKAAAEGAEELITEGGEKLVKNAAGKWVNASTGKFVSKATVEAAQNATTAVSKSTGNILTKLTSFFKKKGSKVASETAEDVLTETAEALGKAATNSAGSGIQNAAELAVKEHKGFLQKCIDAVKSLSSDKGVEKALKEGGSEVAEATAKKGLKSVLNQLTEWLGKAMIEIAQNSKVGKKIVTLIAGKSAATGAKTAAAVGTAGLVEIASIGLGLISGTLDTGKIANLFEVSQSMVTFKMRMISGILNAFLSSTVGAYVEIALLVVELITGFDVTKWMAQKLYDLFSSDAGKEKLDKAQDTLAVETQLYNQKHGTNMTTEEYNDAANKSWTSKAWNSIKGFFGGKNNNIDNKGLAKEAASIVNSGNYSISTNGDVSIGNGNGAVGYGPGQSQMNSAWANMPIGRFANGQISTMKTGGCGPTALSTIANMYGPGINPGTVGAYAASNGFISAGGANEDLFTRGAAGLGLHGIKVGKDEVTSALSTGHPMAISGKNSGPFTKNGHVVVANGISNNKISVIDPMDGKSKVYNKNDITSGMTNAWAYERPVGYGLISNIGKTVKDKVLTGLSSNVKSAMINTLGTVQTALANVPVIMESSLDSIFSSISKTIVTPLSVPIKYAVNALSALSKMIGGESITDTELTTATNTNSMLSTMSSEIKDSMNAVKISSSNISSSKLTSNIKNIFGTEGILNRSWSKLSSKNSSNTVGYGTSSSNIDTVNSNIDPYGFNTGTLSYYDLLNSANMGSLGLSTYNTDPTIKTAYKTLNNIPTLDTTPKASSTSDVNISEDTSDTDDNSDVVISNLETQLEEESSENRDYIAELKTSLSKGYTSFGNFISGFKKIGKVIEALYSTITGGGSFIENYEKLASGDEEDETDESAASLFGSNDDSNTSSVIVHKSDAASTDGIIGSGNYTEYKDTNERKKNIWRYFKSKGYPLEAIAGIMGCWDAESGNNPLVYEGYYLDGAKKLGGADKILASNAAMDNYVQNVLFPAYDNTPSLKGKINKNAYLNDDGHYYMGMGLAQWTGPRARKLFNYGNSGDEDWRDLYTQLDFTSDEINSRGIRSDLKSQDNINSATEYFAKNFEVGGYTGDGLAKRQSYAHALYDTYKNVGFGTGPVSINTDKSKWISSGYDYTDWSDFTSGLNSASDYLNTIASEWGLDSYINNDNTNVITTDDNGNVVLSTNTSKSTGVTYDSSKWGKGNMAPVDAMKSIIGKIRYSQEYDEQDPDKGSASCASTVAWAYKKGLGIRPGDTVNADAYMRSRQQSLDSRFTTIFENDGSGLSSEFIHNNLMPGDIVYTNWNETSNDTGELDHTEMYVGDGKDLSHGNPDKKGPNYVTLDAPYRRKHTMLIRRYNGFLKDKDDVAYGIGPNSEDMFDFENELSKEINSTSNDYTTNIENNNSKSVGYGTSGTNNSDITTRLDKIVTIIGEWYMMNKQETKNSSTVNNTVVTNNNTAVTNNQAQKTKTSSGVTSHIDKLIQKHQTYSRMYKTTI